MAKTRTPAQRAADNRKRMTTQQRRVDEAMASARAWKRQGNTTLVHLNVRVARSGNKLVRMYADAAGAR